VPKPPRPGYNDLYDIGVSKGDSAAFLPSTELTITPSGRATEKALPATSAVPPMDFTVPLSALSTSMQQWDGCGTRQVLPYSEVLGEATTSPRAAPVLKGQQTSFTQAGISPMVDPHKQSVGEREMTSSLSEVRGYQHLISDLTGKYRDAMLLIHDLQSTIQQLKRTAATCTCGKASLSGFDGSAVFTYLETRQIPVVEVHPARNMSVMHNANSTEVTATDSRAQEQQVAKPTPPLPSPLLSSPLSSPPSMPEEAPKHPRSSSSPPPPLPPPHTYSGRTDGKSVIRSTANSRAKTLNKNEDAGSASPARPTTPLRARTPILARGMTTARKVAGSKPPPVSSPLLSPPLPSHSPLKALQIAPVPPSSPEPSTVHGDKTSMARAARNVKDLESLNLLEEMLAKESAAIHGLTPPTQSRQHTKTIFYDDGRINSAAFPDSEVIVPVTRMNISPSPPTTIIHNRAAASASQKGMDTVEDGIHPYKEAFRDFWNSYSSTMSGSKNGGDDHMQAMLGLVQPPSQVGKTDMLMARIDSSLRAVNEYAVSMLTPPPKQ
jgi:hypothetical protein